MRFGSVAIVGRTNVGKSTFLNAVLGQPLAIVSPLPQTTRDELLGVLHRTNAQIAFRDTPGLHRPKTELGRRMNATALGTLRSNDAVLFVTDVARLAKLPKTHWRPDFDPIHPEDRRLLQALPRELPCVLMVNKVDLLKDKTRLLPLLEAFHEAHPFRAVVPTAALKEDGLERVLEELEALLPEGEQHFEADQVTDRPVSFFAREYVREQILLRTRSEVPHAVAVSIDRFEAGPRTTKIAATIHVEKPGQRTILVGRSGAAIKAIGMGARERIEQLLGQRVHLELFVRVTDRWKDTPRQLRELGYESEGRSLQSLLGPAPRRIAPPRDAASKKRSPSKGGTKKSVTPSKPGKSAPSKGGPRPRSKKPRRSKKTSRTS